MRGIGVVMAALLLSGCQKEPAMTDNKTMGSPTAGPVTLVASATSTVLDVSWTNNTGASLKIATHVFAGEKQFDWLEVSLTDGAGALRRLRFMDDRDESAAVFVDVAPGATAHETIDLAAWAKRSDNGNAPLAAGTYKAKVVYDSTHETKAWAGRLEATTTITVP